MSAEISEAEFLEKNIFFPFVELKNLLLLDLKKLKNIFSQKTNLCDLVVPPMALG